MEHLDDIAIHYPDGAVTVEQTKSALRQNPLADWAEDFWKAIANWLDGLANGNIPARQSRFRIYVTPPRQGGWAAAMHDATTAEDVSTLLEAIKAKHNKFKKPKGCEAYLQRFLTAPDQERVTLVTRMSVQSNEADPVDSLRALIKTAVAPNLVDALCEAAIGMAKEWADRLIRDSKPASIDGDAFKDAFRAFVQKTNIPGLLTSFAAVPHVDEVDAFLAARPVFIRQLEIIDVPDDDRVRAVSDFLRTSADKSLWAEYGLVFEGSLSDWDDHLVSRYGLICGEITDLYGDKDAALRGRLAYRRCAQLQAPLDGRAVPGHFVHGSFNALADVMRLGWHPDYQSLLTGETG